MKAVRAMRSVGAAMAAMVLAGAPAAAQGLPVDLELAIAVDISGSVDAVEAQLQRDGYIAAFSDPEVQRAIEAGMLRRVAVLYFEWGSADHQQIVLDWRLVDGAEGARRYANALAEAPIGSGRFTSISGAIDFVVPLFETNGYDGTRRVIDISGDGPNNSGRLSPLARDDAVGKGITINGLPILNDRFDRWGRQLPDLDAYYRDCVIGGPGAFMIIAEDFESFALAVRRKLILEIAGRVPDGGAVRVRHARIAPSPLLHLASDGPDKAACDMGERQFRYRGRGTGNY